MDPSHNDASASASHKRGSMLQLWSCSEPKKYVAKETGGVVAIRLDLKTEGFGFAKWGGSQTCKRNDWLVYNLLDKDTYVVDDDIFKETYEEQPGHPGRYKKTATVFAVEAKRASLVTTIEGQTEYEEGDFIVSHRFTGSGLYAMPPCKFHKKYLDHDEHVAKEREHTRIERENITKLLKVAREEKENVRESLKTNKTLYNGLQITSIIASTIVPVAFLLEDYKFSPAELVAAIVAAIAVVSSAVQSFQKYSDKCARDTIALNELKNLVGNVECETGDAQCAEEIKAKLKEIREARDSFLHQRGEGRYSRGAAD